MTKGMTRSNAKGNTKVNQNYKGKGNKNVYTLDLKKSDEHTSKKGIVINP